MQNEKVKILNTLYGTWSFVKKILRLSSFTDNVTIVNLIKSKMEKLQNVTCKQVM